MGEYKRKRESMKVRREKGGSKGGKDASK